MRHFKSALLFVFLLSCSTLLFSTSKANAQDKLASPDRPGVSSPGKPSLKKQPVTLEPDEEQKSSAPGESSKDDGPEAIRKRAEWFYKQRSSVNGRIPAGARLKAFQHMQRMMVAEGKLAQRPDGSYAEVNPQSSPPGAVTNMWASIGPTPTTGGFFSPVTGRITAIAVDPSDATGNTVLIGGAMGGIWRSTDAGATWTPVGDQNASLAMGSIAFAPSQPATVYAGTGEQASIGFDIYYGAGVLKSTDHGQTWTQTCTVAGSACPFIGPYLDTLNPGFGFFNFGGAHISYVAVNPTNPNMVLVGAQFIVEGPQEGVYCSDNGGTTWSNILPDEMSTFVGFASSTVAYAALGNPFGNSSGAPNGNGIFKATGIGSTCSTIHFARLSASLPPISSMGRIDMGIAPRDTSGNTVYASISDASTGSSTNLAVFVTTNGGTSWTQTSAPDICRQQCWYDNVVKVDPNNNSIAFFGGSAVTDASGNYSWVMRTTNGGTSWSTVIPNLPSGSPGLPHVDVHALAFVKLSTGNVRLYMGNDGGIWRTDDAEAAAVTWTNLNNASLTLTQFYPSISISPSSPAIAFGGTQDNASQNYQSGVSWVDNQLCGDGASTAVDSVIASTVYIGCATGVPINASYQNGAVGTFSPAINGINSSDTASFIPPLAVDPNNPNTLYFGTNRIYQSTDAGNTWTPISGNFLSGSEWINTLAVASGAPQVVYAGTNIGAMLMATNVSPGTTANFSFVGGSIFPPRSITSVAVDPADSTGMTAYATFSGFSFVGTDDLGVSINDPGGHIFKTTNGGNTWTDVSCSSPTSDCSKPAPTDLPNVPVNDIVVDPDLPGVVYAATDLGVFLTSCSSAPCAWSTLSTGLPRVAVLSLKLHEPSRTLRAATHGRGAWDINLNNFSFTGPHISSLSPVSANSGTSSAVTLTVNGSGLTGGTVQWNGSASNVTTTQVSGTQLTASIAASLINVAGTSKITVLNGTPSNALTFSILAGTPAITSISPSSTPVQSAPSSPVPIQVTGTNFAASAKVLFNGAQNGITVAAPTTSCPLPTCLSATLPAALLGPTGSTNSISVLNLPPGGGQSKPVNFQVVAPPPPNDNFVNAINIIPYTFGDAQDSSGATTESTDPTPPCIQQSPGNTGGHPNGAYNTIWYQFTPVVSAGLNMDTIGSTYDTVLSVWSGSPGSFVNVACNDDIVPGVNIQSQLSNVQLTAGTTYYIMVSSFGPPDPNPIALGGGTFFHFSFNGGLTPAPTITSISPISASSGGPAFTLAVNGSGFLNGAIVDFNNSTTSFGTALPATFVSSSQLTATVPASQIILPGPFTVNVLNPTPTVGPSNFVNFTVNLGVLPVPVLGFISPTTAIAGSLPFRITAACQNCASTAFITFNGVSESSTVSNSFSSPYQQNVSATISTADISTAGTVQVTVSNPAPGGGTSAPQPFVITQPTVVPTITSVNPATIVAGFPVSFTVNGTGFAQGAALNVGGSFGGNYYSTNFVSPTQLSVPSLAVNSVGTLPVYVIDPPPAGTSSGFNLTVTQPPPPTVTSITPTSAQSGSSLMITITGTNFQPGASVTFNGSSFSGSTLSSTVINANLGLGGVPAGTYPLTVVNPIPTPTSSNAVNFTVTAPPDFSITDTSATSQTVNAGQTATFTNGITVSPLNGFSAQVALMCSLPPAATYTTCSVNPSTLATGSGTATVTVTTTGQAITPPILTLPRFNTKPQWVPLFLLALMLAITLLHFGRTRRQRLAGVLPFAILILVLVFQVIGCGGGSSGGPPPPPPIRTPTGSYMITVTGTASTNTGTLQHQAVLTLTVN